ncbi:MAG: hypothetical protein KA164_08445 [Rhodoferax sp.]|jgi:hypothetical protein|nr:hypothetical protein [Rhodoferax sp.]
MRAPIMTAAAVVLALALTACSPAFNWRETVIEATQLSAMFPCKPEKAARQVALGGGTVELTMHHCDTEGVTAAVGHAPVSDPALAGPALAQWRVATLAAMRVKGSTQSAWVMERSSVLPQALVVEAAGTSSDGGPLVLKAAWFARGSEVYAALLYGPALSPEVAEVFFSGLRFR